MGVIKSFLVLFCPILFVGLSYAICYFSTNFALAKCHLFHSSPGDMSDASLDYLKHYNMKIFQFLLVVSLLPSTSVMAQEVQFTPLADNAVRVKYGQPRESRLPDWIYINKESQATSPKAIHDSSDKEGNVIIRDAKGKVVFKSVGMSLSPSSVQGEPTQIAELSFVSPKKGKEYQYGLGQFQDGVSDVFGLTRRLTQVNTQISVPMLMSSNGYAILWNNYGLTEFNPCSHSVKLSQVQDDGNGKDEVVDVTTTSGNRREVRHSNAFSAEIDIDRTADYTFLLDVGQKMARKHWMSIDGDVVVDMNNVWLPPTTSTTLHLTKGRHTILVQGTRGDQPVVYWEEIDQTTTFRSPVAECVDFTVFTGRPDEIVATYRKLTGQAPAMPEWALGYIHCRERFHSQDEILATARRFQKENIPLDVIVQDWQWWGKYGWNAMQFDEDHYPQPKEMTGKSLIVSGEDVGIPDPSAEASVNGLDLSVGSQIAFMNICVAAMIDSQKIGPVLAVIIGLLATTILGGINGYVISKTNVPPLIATLAMQNVLRGCAYLISHGYPIYSIPKGIKVFGQGYLLKWIPVPGIILIVIIILGSIVLNRTYLGRHFYAMGNNAEAARLAGINVRMTRTIRARTVCQSVCV